MFSQKVIIKKLKPIQKIMIEKVKSTYTVQKVEFLYNFDLRGIVSPYKVKNYLRKSSTDVPPEKVD